ncbi:MAG: septum formation protein Maf [Armatimonadetes bacterium]|nr:septum formation protein Maf [Armatimonadota bacterium]
MPWPVVLASASPRRQELLRRLVPEFDVVPAHVDEDALTVEDPFVTAQKLAREKALVVASSRPESLVVAGDTVVALQNGNGWRQLAKPIDEADAVAMLNLLAGRTHTVVTGVCLRWPGGLSAFTEASQVTFRALKMGEAEAYVATGSPMDKAGAYGLQDGSQSFVEKVEGSVTNVIGLPMERLEEAFVSLTAKK